MHFARADTDNTPNYAGASIVAQFPEAQVTGQYPKGELAFLTSTATNSAPSEKMRLTASGSVGIGTASPSRQLEIYDDGTNGQAVLAITAQNTENSRIMFADPDDNNIGILDYNHSDDSMRFIVNNSERLRILSTGDIAFGNTVANTASGYTNQPGGGYVASDSHFEFATTSNRAPVEIGNNNANDGKLIAFRTQSTNLGTVGVHGGRLFIADQVQNTGVSFYQSS